MPIGEQSAQDQALATAMRGLDFSNPAAGLNSLGQFLSHVLDLPASEVLPVVAAGAPAILPLLAERLTSRQVKLLLVVLQEPEELDAATRAMASFLAKQPHAQVAAVCCLSKYDDRWFIPTILAPTDEGLARQVQSLLAPTAEIVGPASGGAARRASSRVLPASSLILDERVTRMARLAIASSSAVILVGPPGTGKTTFIRELLQEIAYAPESFGLSAAPKEPKWVTPNENWTALDLLGGQVLDDKGRRRYSLGHLLEAIRHDRWLVLDEANRANMDRICGPMLTWLSDQRVELGRASSEFNSPPIVLDWGSQGPCQTIRLELLDADKIMVSDPIEFQAGSDWRLLGTFNAQDATRVFGFGNALSRRFSQVPMPPVRTSQFRQALAPLVRELPPVVNRTILGVYSAHLRSPKALLGPAIFLKMAAYVRAGVRLPALAGFENPPHHAEEEVMLQLISEGYLTCAGPWLGKLSDADLDALGQLNVESGLPAQHWEWVRSLLSSLT